MQSQSTDHSFSPNSQVLLNHLTDATAATPGDAPEGTIEPIQFYSRFVDCMKMNANPETVANYLNDHPDWFGRCAQPMKVQPLANNGYALIIGRFGSFGYELEPKIGLHLLPENNRVYRIETVPVPDYIPQGYDVDFQAEMTLVSATVTGTGNSEIPATHVKWQLDLKVTIQFPRFIYALPKPLIQHTGDQLLQQIVRQVSRRLTHKVQEDFHNSRKLPMPKSSRKWLFQKSLNLNETDVHPPSD